MSEEIVSSLKKKKTLMGEVCTQQNLLAHALSAQQQKKICLQKTTINLETYHKKPCFLTISNQAVKCSSLVRAP